MDSHSPRDSCQVSRRLATRPLSAHDPGRMRRDLPSGTVTFLFTDVEGSTRLLHELGAEAYAEALAEHRRVIREACAREGGVEVDTQGDAFFFAFPTAPGALAAASAITEALASGPIQVRVGLHTGTPLVDRGGLRRRRRPLRRPGRRLGARRPGHLSRMRPPTLVELPLTDLGEHRLKDIAEAVSIFQLGNGSFPPLKTISNTNLPRPASSFVGPRGRARGRALADRGRRAARHPHRPRRHGQDAARDRGRGDARPRVQGGRLLGRARRAPRPRARHRDDRADARRQGRPRRAHRRAGAAAPARQPRAGDRGRARALRAPRGLPQPDPARHEPRAPAHAGRGRVRGASARRARGGRPLLRARAARADARRSPSSARASTRSRSRSSSPPRARRRSPRPRSSSASRSASTCSRAAATPTPASRRCARRSSGATTCSHPRSSSSSLASPSSPAAAPSRPPRRSPTPTSTRCSRSSRRASCASPTSATGCSRRSASTRASGSSETAERDERRATCRPLRVRSRRAGLHPSCADAAAASRLRRLEPERDNLRAALTWAARARATSTSSSSSSARSWRFWWYRGHLREGLPTASITALERERRRRSTQLRTQVLEAAA